MDFIRGKSKYKSNYQSRNIYYFFTKHTKMYTNRKKHKERVPESQFVRVFRTFADRVSDEVVNNFFSFKMPYGLGSLYIHSYKQDYRIGDNGKLVLRKKMIDVVSTKMLWDSNEDAKTKREVVLKDYSATDDVIYKIRWSKASSKFINNKFYVLKPSRLFKSKVYEACVDGTITSYN